ncbi:MAG TPA: neprosin family prolyl endopeptidase [Pseudolabrys sp.]|nr:neprosin family prolyl endopeptidase [Pseudolabrys sp.]
MTLGIAPAAAQTASGFVPFGEFIQSVRSANVAAFSGSRVSGAVEFNEMRQYVLGLYDSVQVHHSYALGSQVFDCVPVAQQPSARDLAPRAIAPPPPMPPGGGSAGAVQSVTQVDPQQRADAYGNSIGCEAGTIPMRRVTLQELSRFQTLQQFFRKSPDGTDDQHFNHGVGPSVTATHKYAHAYQNVTNYGGTSALNIWRPSINTAKQQVFSLSQHWYVNFASGKTQTVEGGWQNYPQKYGSQNSALFIYWTADGYNKTGCYNLDCKAFVQTYSSVHLGHGFSKYSTAGGSQYEFTLTWYLYQGNWWMGYGSNWVGYYPGSLWSNKNLAKSSSEIDYGGETVGTTTWPPMGGGSFASKGFKYAAFQRLIKYYNNNSGSGTVVNAMLTMQQPSPKCYTINVFNNSATNYKSYFYFGGPGGSGC